MKKEFTRRSSIYFISDTHFGGEGELAEVDVINELRILLKTASNDDDSELIIVGDVFGIWEFSDIRGLKSFYEAMDQQKEVLNLFSSYTGQLKITFLPGNHDHVMACYNECRDFFSKLNINLEQSQVIFRQVGDKKIWIEHGNQLDPANTFTPFGDDNSTPLGYYITEGLVAAAGKYSKKGKKNWIKNMQSIGSNPGHLTSWVSSGYFYYEMAKWLQIISTPLMIFLSYSAIALIAQLFKFSGLISKNYLIHNFLTEKTSYFGNILSLIIWADIIILVLGLIMAIPIMILRWDFRQFISRYKLTSIYQDYADSAASYEKQINTILDINPDIDFYVYGHTHDFMLRNHADATVLNTGTWLKSYKRIKLKGLLLPDVYIPYYQLGYFKIKSDQLEFSIVPKKTDLSELTFLQKILILPYKKSIEPNLKPFKRRI
jgi:UDP-2,3-diacylglucosamine pyrophosphatase LpxH